MKNIKSFEAPKYTQKGFLRKNPYKKVQEGIYENATEKLYVTSLSFEQEPEYGEGENASDISQYPLEDILDRFYCHISDFYEELNVAESKVCYYEFEADDLDDIINLRSIIGKHVYNKDVEREGKIYTMLIID